MAQHVTTTTTVDESTIKVRESGEMYVDPTAFANGVQAAGVWSLGADGTLSTLDTATGITYKLVVTNGLMQPVEV